MKISEIDNSWQELLTFLPSNWIALGHETGALKGLRKDKSPANLLRTMLIHCACGYSLRETAVRARLSKLAEMSDVALLKRLKKCGPWFQAMSHALLQERGAHVADDPGLKLRVFDATHVKEPGQTGSQWRVHYSINLPQLDCDYFSISPTRGAGTSESLCNFPIAGGDHILADRGYCKCKGLDYVARQGAYITIRLRPSGVHLVDLHGEKFNLSQEILSIDQPGQVGEWDVGVKVTNSEDVVYGRICAMLKTDTVAARARKLSQRKASKDGKSIRWSTLLYANYIILFTTFNKAHNSHDILRYYRLRWQIELVFKRFKQIANFGHLPKHDDASSKAWLYGKLFVALLIEKLHAYGGAISPWRVFINQTKIETQECLERILFHIPFGDRSNHSTTCNTQGAFDLA